jgi:hypothetical protein
LEKQDFGALNHDEQIDFLLFRNHLAHDNAELARYRSLLDEVLPIVPFASVISDLEDSRRRLEPVDPAKLALVLANLAKQTSDTQRAFADGSTAKPKRTVANRAVRTIASLRTTFGNWYKFYNSYDPLFTWWVAEPYKSADEALQN